MAESDRPRMPRPAATGTASARSPIRSARVTPSISATILAFGALLQIPNLVLHLLLCRARADRSCHVSQIAGQNHRECLEQQQHADHDERRETGDPKRLWNDG